MKKYLFATCIFLSTYFHFFAQGMGLSFDDAEAQGISTNHLDSTYQNAVNVDTTLAVFKTANEQEKLFDAYSQLRLDLAAFLKEHNFFWEKQTRCFNRVYFNKDGKIDYFLYNCTDKDGNKPNEVRQNEFKRLLNLFIQDYQFPMKADVKFVQCGGSNYSPKHTEP